MTIPFPPATWELTSPRLVIRTALPSEADAVYAVNSKPENLPVGEKAEPGFTVEKQRARIEKWKELQTQGTTAWLIITLRETGEVIGTHGFNCFRAQSEVQPEGPDVPSVPPVEGVEGRYLTDIGITIDHTHWRKGYASEALVLSVEHAFEELGCKVVRIETSISNEPWIEFMHSLGLDGEKKGKVSWGDGSADGLIWKFDGEVWQKVRDSLRANKKWPL